VSSALVTPLGDQPLTTAQITVLWVMADELDRRRIPSDVEDAVWLEIPSKRLRDPDGRDDNFWLRKCLKRLSKIEIGGIYKDTAWGAVMVAEWHMQENGSITRILMPPAAIKALRSPETFAKIETFAAYKLSKNAKKLYGSLADKKRMTKREPYWIYELEELQRIIGTDDKKSYKQWYEFRRWVLEPIIKEINDYGTVTISMKPIKTGRSITAVRFDWEWKSIDEARETDEENQRHSVARRKQQPDEPDAPPTITSGADRLKQEWLDWSNANPGGIYSDFLHEKRSRKS